MSLRAYSEINLHIIWRVKHDQPVLQDEIEHQVQRLLRGRAVETAGVFFHAVGGTDDHVHLVVSIPPTLTISDWVGEIKGACSHTINHEIANRDVLHWQTGYGVVSFGTRDLPWVVSYVKEQRTRHAAGRAEPRLERIEPHDSNDASAQG